MAGGSGCARAPREPGNCSAWYRSMSRMPALGRGPGLGARRAVGDGPFHPHPREPDHAQRPVLRPDLPARSDRFPSPLEDRDPRTRSRLPRILTMDDLRPMVEPQGTHLMECAGNPRASPLRADQRRELGGDPARDGPRARRTAVQGDVGAHLWLRQALPGFPSSRWSGRAGSSRPTNLSPAGPSWRRR